MLLQWRLSNFCIDNFDCVLGWIMLQEIITAKHLAPQVDVRLLATVYFKNSINRYWRSRRDSLYDILLSFCFFCIYDHFIILEELWCKYFLI